MKTPVIIAAYNEAELIGKCLSHLDRDQVEPIVSVNGSTDATAEIARGFGVKVLDRPEQGKLPAIQDALKLLGRTAINTPVFVFRFRFISSQTTIMAKNDDRTIYLKKC